MLLWSRVGISCTPNSTFRGLWAAIELPALQRRPNSYNIDFSLQPHSRWHHNIFTHAFYLYMMLESESDTFRDRIFHRVRRNNSGNSSFPSLPDLAQSDEWMSLFFSGVNRLAFFGISCRMPYSTHPSLDSSMVHGNLKTLELRFNATEVPVVAWCLRFVVRLGDESFPRGFCSLF